MATKTPPGSPQGQPDPQPSTPTYTTPPLYPPPGPTRGHNWGYLLVIAILVIILIWVLVASHLITGRLVSDSFPPSPANPSQTTAPATPSGTATTGSPTDTATPTSSASSPTPTASAGAGVPIGGSTPKSTVACNTAPTVPQRSLAVTLPQPAGSPEARSELQQLADAGYDTVFYTGEPKSATVVNQWMADVQCAGMASALQVDNVFNLSGDPDAKTFVAAVQGHADLKAFVVSMNGVPSGTSEAGNAGAVNSRVAAIKSQTGKPVWCELDNMTASQAASYSSCDHRIVGYFPWRKSEKYGPVSALKDVGRLTKQLDGAGATVGVQAFDWWASEPAAAQALGFTQNTAGLPAPADVRDMAKLATSNGSVDVLVVSEEPAADNSTYLVAIGKAFRPTRTCAPQGS